jgi:YD repeat-containing protein
MTDGTGLTTYHYDAVSRRTRKSWHPAGLDQPLTLEYDYDPAGNLVQLRSTPSQRRSAPIRI